MNKNWEKGTVKAVPFLVLGMLEAVALIFLILAWLSLLFFLAGLIRPVLVLWFLDRMNRLKVIKIYGLSFLIFIGIYFIIELLSNNKY